MPILNEDHSQEYSFVLQDGLVQLACKLYVEINKTGVAGDYLIDVKRLYIDEQEAVEYYVYFAERYHALVDREGASKVDFLVVQYVALMMMDVGFASGR